MTDGKGKRGVRVVGPRGRRAWMLMGVPAALLAGAALAFAAAGDLDATFGTGGVATVTGAAYCTDAAIQTDGKTVAVGIDSSSWVLRRFLPDGSLDTGYGGGVARLGYGNTSNSMVRAVALDGGGAALVAGRSQVTVRTTVKNKTTTTVYSTACVARVHPDGTLDTGFGNGGLAGVVVSGEIGSEARAVLVQPDGKILLAGSVVLPVSKFSSQQAQFVARLLANGSLDTAFGAGGIRVNDLTSGDDPIYGSNSIALQSDGKIVLGGFAGGSGSTYSMGWVITRFTPSGAIDTTFGPVRVTSGWFLRGVAVDAYDRILALGDTNFTSASDVLVARYTANGALDGSFGGQGTTTVHLQTDNNGLQGPVLQADGKILVAASLNDGSATTTSVVRLDGGGGLDTAFGSGGATAPLSLSDAAAPGTFCTALNLTPSGQILLSGYAYRSGAPYDWFLARYDAN